MYLALPHSRGSFPQDFTCLVVLKNENNGRLNDLRYGAFTLFGALFQEPLLSIMHSVCVWKNTMLSSYNTSRATASTFHQRFQKNLRSPVHVNFTREV